MFAVFEDLEQQAAGLRLAERDVEVAELSVAEYSRIGFAERVHASLGREVALRLVGGHQVSGRLQRCGLDWLLLVDGTREWVVRSAAVATASGLASRADSQETWSVVDRLTLRSLLRRLSVESARCVVHFVDQSVLRGQVRRVGHDFVELYVGEAGSGSLQLVALGSVAALQEQP